MDHAQHGEVLVLLQTVREGKQPERARSGNAEVGMPKWECLSGNACRPSARASSRNVLSSPTAMVSFRYLQP